MAQTIVEEDRGTGVDTRLERARAELTAHTAPTRSDGARAARLAKEAELDATAGVGARFKRWVRRMTLRVALILVAAGGAAYLTWPHLPARTRQPIDDWLRRLGALVGQRHP